MAAYRAPTTCADWGRGQRTCNLQIWKRMAAFWAADFELIHGLGDEIMSGVGVGYGWAKRRFCCCMVPIRGGRQSGSFSVSRHVQITIRLRINPFLGAPFSRSSVIQSASDIIGCSVPFITDESVLKYPRPVIMQTFLAMARLYMPKSLTSCASLFFFRYFSSHGNVFSVPLASAARANEPISVDA